MLHILVIIILITCPLLAKEVEEQGEEKQIKIGNFSLPTSQQIGPLLGFGQNIVDKHDFLAYAYYNRHIGIDHSLNHNTLTPNILYGISDKFSLQVALPIAVRLQQFENVSHGQRDLYIQLEYAVYNKDTKTTADMITIVGNIVAPTGSFFKNPATGYGAFTPAIGFTASHQTIDWYCYISAAAITPLSFQGNKTGNIYYYQAGWARNIGYGSEQWLAALLFEMSGWYKARNKIMGVTDPNSGSHQILLMPSLFFSTTHLIFQIGVAGFPLSHYFGAQGITSRYYIACNVGWKF